MGNKALIAGLLIIILVQGLLVVIQQVHADRTVRDIVAEKLGEHRDPVVYITDLTEALEQYGETREVLSFQTAWLDKHLRKCLEVLEEVNELEPIPMDDSGVDYGPGMMGPGMMGPGMMGPGMMGPGMMGPEMMGPGMMGPGMAAWSHKSQQQSKGLYECFDIPERREKQKPVEERPVRHLCLCMWSANNGATAQKKLVGVRIGNYAERLKRLAETYDKAGSDRDQ